MTSLKNKKSIGIFIGLIKLKPLFINLKETFADYRPDDIYMIIQLND
jgi:hypothetical protein